MQKIIYLIAIAGCFHTTRATAQLSGVKTVPGDYATIAAAVSALNSQGLSTAVTINVAAGHTETAPAGGILLGSSTLHSGAVSLSASRTLTIRKNGTGANPRITAFTPGTGTTDGIFKIAGADYVTIDGVDLAENSSNTNETQQMEWGYALVKYSSSAPFNGCNHVTIKNAVITLNKSNTGAAGIHAGNHTATSTAPLAVTADGDANSDNMFLGNTIQNVCTGIELKGYNAAPASTHLYDQNNIIGGTGADGNVVRNFGRTTGVVTDVVSGIYLVYQNNASVLNNTVDNLAGGGSLNLAGALHGIYHDTAHGSAVLISGNTIVLEQDSLASKADFYPIRTEVDSGATPSVTVSGNTITAKGGYGKGFAFIYHNGNVLREVISGNIFAASRINSWDFFIIRNTNAVPDNGSVVIRDNRISGGMTLKLTGGAGKAPIFYGIYNSGAAAGTSRDTIAGNTLTGIFANMTTNNIFKPIYDNAGAAAAPYPAKFIYGNRFGDLGAAGTSLQVNGIIASRLGRHAGGFSGIFDNVISNTRLNNGIGISVEAATGQTVDIYGNRIDSCSDNGANVKGIQIAAGDTVRVFNNILRNITTSGASSSVKAIAIGTGGLSVSVYNNIISDLETPASGANPAITGIELLGGAFLNVWHNTLRLHPAASTGTSFGVAGIFFNGTPIGVDISNNIVSVDAVPTGKGYAAALCRDAGGAGTVPANLTTMNGNVWYVNTTPRHAYLYAEGADTTALTNAFVPDADFNTPCSDWKKFMSPQESNSFTEDNLAATGALDLYAPAGASYAKERAAALPEVPADRDGVARPALADAGALQFTGTAIPAPVATGFAEIVPPVHNGYCTGDSLTLMAKVYPGMSYQWQKDGADIPAANDTLLHVSQTGSYTVVANSGQCADTSLSLAIAEYPLPTPAITVNGNELSTGAGYTSWQWYLDGNAVPQATGATHTATQSGSYTVAVTDSNGCTGMSAAQQVEVSNRVGSIAGNTAVRVYPNPASGKLYIAAPYAGRVSLSLSSIAGQEVRRQQHAMEMDISTLAPGMYILKITDDAGNLLQVEKIRKEHR